MKTATLKLADNRTSYKPGEEIKGQVEWQLDEAPRSAELVLFWFTTGKGTEDMETVYSLPFEEPYAGDKREFAFHLPRFPYSYHGNLVSFSWMLELTIDRPDASDSIEIEILPDAGPEEEPDQ